MNPTSPNLPRAQYSATFPRLAAVSTETPAASSTSPAADLASKLPRLAGRGRAFVTAHWKQLGGAALGLLALRSARLRPLLRKAAWLFAVPAARNLLARGRR